MSAENNCQRTSYKIIRLEDFFELQLKTFKLLGLNIVPMKITSAQSKIKDLLMKYYFFACIFGFFLLIFQFAILIDVTNVLVVVRTLPNVVLYPYNCCKGLLFFIVRKRILQLWDKLKLSFPTTQIDQQNFKLDAQFKRFRLFFKTYSSFYLATLSFALFGVFYQLIVEHIMELPIFMWFPYNYTKNIFVFICTVIYGFWTNTNACICVVGADFLIFAFVFLLAIEFEIIGENLKNAINGNQTEILHKYIDHHQELFEIGAGISSLFTFIFFYTILQAAVSISSCGFLLLTSQNPADFMFSMSYTTSSFYQVFLYCYFGEKLITASENVGNNILDSNWYEMKDAGMKKSILIVVMRSQKACKLSGFGFVSLTIETFSNVSLKV